MASLTVCPLCEASSAVALYKVRTADVDVLYQRSGVKAPELKAATSLALLRCEACDLRYFFPPLEGGDAFYGALQDIEWYYQADKPEFAVAAKAIQDAKSVLEIGCGRGLFARILADRTSYVGLELSTRAVSTAQAEGLDVRAELVGQHAEVATERYDAVVSFQVLEHVAQPGEFVRDAVRCLRPGGTLVISVPSEDGFMGSIRNNCFNMPPHHLTRWTDRCLSHLAELQRLELLSLSHDELGAEHRGVVAAHLLQNALGLGGKGSGYVRIGRGFGFAERLIRGPARRLAESMAREQLVTWGHSVTAVYRKPPSGVS